MLAVQSRAWFLVNVAALSSARHRRERAKRFRLTPLLLALPSAREHLEFFVARLAAASQSRRSAAPAGAATPLALVLSKMQPPVGDTTLTIPIRPHQGRLVVRSWGDAYRSLARVLPTRPQGSHVLIQYFNFTAAQQLDFRALLQADDFLGVPLAQREAGAEVAVVGAVKAG